MVATCALVLFVATEGLFASLQLLERFVFPDWETQIDEGSIGDLVFAITTTWSALAYLAAALLSAVSFLSWLYRTADNARFVGRRRPRTTPTMAVICWFIPILNLFRPYREMKTLYWASEPPAPDLAGDWIRRAPGLLPLWWATWLITSVVGNASLRLSLSHRPGDEALSMWLDVAAFPFTFIAGLCAIAVLWSIQLRQEALAERDGATDDDHDDHDDRPVA